MKSIVITIFLFLSVGRAKAEICVFCKQEMIEAQQVFTSDYFRVIADYEPRVKGHLLVIPKRHVMKAHELSEEEWKDLSIVIPQVVKVFAEFLNTDQYIILEKNGRNAFQRVSHVHFHMFPIHSESWSEIFDRVPKQLTPEELAKEVTAYKSYFYE